MDIRNEKYLKQGEDRQELSNFYHLRLRGSFTFTNIYESLLTDEIFRKNIF